MKRTGFQPRAKPMSRCAISPGTAKLTIKKRACKNRACRNKFTPTERHPFAIACCTGCEIILAKQHLAKVQEARAKKERKSDKARKEALKSRGDWIEDVQKVFNAYIRARDAGQPCICCGKPFEPQRIGGSVDAGHYRSRGSASHLRFDERNCHAQRKNCNRPGGTTHASFRAGMEARIGTEALEALESDQTSRDWTIDDLKALKRLYRGKLKAVLQANDGVATNE